jgi:hypothetical protein
MTRACTIAIAVILPLTLSAATGSDAGAATMKASYLACKYADTFNRAEALRRSSDREAAGNFVAKIILSGQCIWLHAGTTVQIVESAEGPLYVSILPPGEGVSFVTYRQFVE